MTQYSNLSNSLQDFFYEHDNLTTSDFKENKEYIEISDFIMLLVFLGIKPEQLETMIFDKELKPNLKLKPVILENLNYMGVPVICEYEYFQYNHVLVNKILKILTVPEIFEKFSDKEANRKSYQEQLKSYREENINDENKITEKCYGCDFMIYGVYDGIMGDFCNCPKQCLDN